jgi:hypothetical protein
MQTALHGFPVVGLLVTHIWAQSLHSQAMKYQRAQFHMRRLAVKSAWPIDVSISIKILIESGDAPY